MKSTKRDPGVISDEIRKYFEENAKGEMDAVLLFGSHAKGEAGTQSDVDLGFLFHDEPDYLRMGYHTARLESILDRRVDSVLLNDLERKNPLLAHEIAEGHRVVFLSHSERYVAFKTRAILFYLDTLPLIEANRESLRRRIRKNRIGERYYVGPH